MRKLLMIKIPEHMFRRMDESEDINFYKEPRFVQHIDQLTIDALTSFYGEFIPRQATVLDLMSSWVSHLPKENQYKRVAILGMNARELEANNQATEIKVHDLNEDPKLPYSENSFDTSIISVSIQYLTKPVAVFSSLTNVLKENGQICIALSHRLFPTKAIYAFHKLTPSERVSLVMQYLKLAGFKNIEFIDKSPKNSDPLWIVTGINGKHAQT
ncbi:MAG: methyltransferase type 11 [Gammaproteobacteria bacterium]|nr:methyltransferase type 11 [Gammaproteobacteria bacterium]